VKEGVPVVKKWTKLNNRSHLALMTVNFHFLINDVCTAS
jgi:hypothetical protein